jgi:hypothetical protein
MRHWQSHVVESTIARDSPLLIVDQARERTADGEASPRHGGDKWNRDGDDGDRREASLSD